MWELRTRKVRKRITSLGSIKNYLIAILFSICSLLGYATYSLVGKLTEARAESSQLRDKVNESSNLITIVTESCDASIASLMESHKIIEDFNKAMYKDLEKLNKLPTQLTIPGTINETTKNSDSSRLSPELMRVLDNAYCSGDKDDPYCTSKGDASGM